MAAKKGISLRNVLSALVALVILIGWTTYHANFVMGRSMVLTFPGWESTYKSAWPRPFGGVVASDVTLTSPYGEQGGTFHFDRVRLDAPFFEYYRSAFWRKRGAFLNSIHSLRFEFSGGHGDIDAALADQLGMFGNLSAAPFETEGCSNDDYWGEGNLLAMGLKPRDVTLVLDYHSEPERFIVEQSLSAPGIGSVSARSELITYGEIAMLNPDTSVISGLTADEWHLKDDGFVAARNEYCAGRSGVDTSAFVQRHVRSVKRILAIVGMAPTPALESAYRNYARDGGRLDVVVHYNPPISDATQNVGKLSDLLPYMDGTFSVNGNTQPLSLVAVEPQPWPKWADSLTTYELVQREDAAANAHSAESVATASAPPPSPVAAAVTRSPVVTAMLAQTPNLAPAETPAAAPVVEDGTISSYRQLADHVGEILTVYQRGRPSARVKIWSVTKSGVVMVRQQYISGYMEQALDRKAFVRAEP